MQKKIISFFAFFTFIVAFILVFSGIVCAAEIGIETDGGVDLVDLSTLFGDLMGGKVFGSGHGLDYKSMDDGIGRFIFTGEDTSLKIDGILFENIIPKGETGEKSYIEVDSLGKITCVNFFVNDKGGEYIIEGVKFDAPPNSKVYYNFEEGFNLPKGAYISKLDDFLDSSKSINFNGENINFMDELIVNGKLKLNKYGYLIEDGEANYEGLKIMSLFEYEQVLIVKNNEDEFVYGKESRTSWIKKGENSLEIQSSKDGRIIMDFQEENKFLDVGPKDKFKLNVFEGDGIRIEKLTEGSKESFRINHKSSENLIGAVEIANDGLIIDIDSEKKIVYEKGLYLEDVLSGKYKAVPVVIASDTFEEELNIDKSGKLEGIIYQRIGNSVEKKVIYELKNPVIDLRDDEFEGLVGRVKYNLESADFLVNPLFYSQEFLSKAKEKGFTNEQSLELINFILEKTGTHSDSYFNSVISGVEKINPSSLRISPEKFNEFTLGIIDYAGVSSQSSQNLLDSYAILEKGLESGKDFDLIKDFSKKVSTSGISGASEFFQAGIKEYNGDNFREISNGVMFLKMYGVLPNTAEFLDLKYSNIKNKNQLATEYASAINRYFENTRVIGQGDSIRAASSINLMHDFESAIDGSDSIRENIINKLSLESKYYLISNSIGTDDLYPSTFEKMYQGFNKGSLVDDIKRIDSSGRYWSDFTVQLSARGKLPEMFKESPDFFRGLIYDSITLKKDSLNYNALYKNSVLMQDVLYDVYVNSGKYPGEKEKFEDFLVERFSKSSDEKEKAIYSYLIKLDENPINRDISRIAEGLPDIRGSRLDEDILEKYDIAGKLYFYDDERSYFDSKESFINNYKMDEEWSDGSTTRLSKPVGNKKIIIDMELNSANIPYVESANEDLMGQFYTYLAHRGHCYHATQTFSQESDSSKIIQDGGCQSYSNLGHWQSIFPNSYIITDKDVGRAIDSDKLIYSTLHEIALGNLDFNEMNLDFAEKAGIFLPERESLESYVRRFNSKQ